MRPGSPSWIWSEPESTSSATARCGGRATRTASRLRSTASTSTIPATRSIARGTRTPFRGSSARTGDGSPFNEPYLQARPEQAREYAVEAIDRALRGIEGDTILHTCFGYAHVVKNRLTGYPFLAELDDCAATHISLEAAQPNLDPADLGDLPSKTIMLGVLDLGSSEAETPEVVVERIRKALTVLPPERLVVAPDCGMKYLPRELAFRKLEAMVAGARLVREELGYAVR